VSIIVIHPHLSGADEVSVLGVLKCVFVVAGVVVGPVCIILIGVVSVVSQYNCVY
jgi:hypothetical protein